MTTTGITALDSVDINSKLSATPAWEQQQGRLYRAFVFSDFATAFSFMSEIAALAERTNHHPDWSNHYNRVEIYLTTHSCAGISEQDFLLAESIDTLLSNKLFAQK